MQDQSVRRFNLAYAWVMLIGDRKVGGSNPPRATRAGNTLKWSSLVLPNAVVCRLVKG